MKEVLQKVRVLDISRYRAGPTCGQILADMGAEVIRIERPVYF
jgi:crotonobetainyl-CoA:carnitine CoA-transferase CaiB-like acyl-CoA transferase